MSNATGQARAELAKSVKAANTSQLMDWLLNLTQDEGRDEATRLLLALICDELCERDPDIESAAVAWTEDLVSAGTYADAVAARVRELRC